LTKKKKKRYNKNTLIFLTNLKMNKLTTLANNFNLGKLWKGISTAMKDRSTAVNRVLSTGTLTGQSTPDEINYKISRAKSIKEIVRLLPENLRKKLNSKYFEG
jgi:hypothetical protein